MNTRSSRSVRVPVIEVIRSSTLFGQISSPSWSDASLDAHKPFASADDNEFAIDLLYDLARFKLHSPNFPEEVPVSKFVQ